MMEKPVVPAAKVFYKNTLHIIIMYQSVKKRGKFKPRGISHQRLSQHDGASRLTYIYVYHILPTEISIHISKENKRSEKRNRRLSGSIKTTPAAEKVMLGKQHQQQQQRRRTATKSSQSRSGLQLDLTALRPLEGASADRIRCMHARARLEKPTLCQLERVYIYIRLVHTHTHVHHQKPYMMSLARGVCIICIRAFCRM